MMRRPNPIRPWEPEHPVGRDLARALVHAQFPELASWSPSLLGVGWDGEVWRFGPVAFRFPRRAAAIPSIELEMRVLPRLTPHLPVPAPLPTHIGEPTEAFPYPWYGHPLLDAIPAEHAGLGDAARRPLARPLGAFFRSLHALPAAPFVALGLRGSRSRRDLRWLAERTRPRLELLRRALPAETLERLAEALGAVPADAPEGTPEHVCHGDAYVRHLLVAQGVGGPAIGGFIDWGDVHVGPPASDLSIAYTFFDAAGREAFFEAYGAVDPATHARARYFGLAAYGVSLLGYAIDVDDWELEQECRGTLRRLGFG